MVEYAVMLGGSVGLSGLGSIPITHMALLGLTALGLMVGGFAVRGVWGAIVATGLGVLGYMYWNHMLPQF